MCVILMLFITMQAECERYLGMYLMTEHALLSFNVLSLT